MKKFLFLILLSVAASAQTIYAQAVSPIVVECGKKCRGEFTVSNGSIKPLAVTVEPSSFSLNPETGKSIFRPLDSTALVTMNETSARIGPQSEHSFDYEVKCGAPPCLVALQTGMIVGHTVEGVQIRVIIPHIVYVCDRSRDCRKNARLAAGLKE